MLKKKAILFIHGFAGGIFDYGQLCNDLQIIDNFDVFIYTLPGHNEIIIKNVTYSDWIIASEKQLKIIINHGYKEIYIIGYSMGGVIASYLASKYKEIKKLILASPAFDFFKFNNKMNFKDGFKSILHIIKKYPLKYLLVKMIIIPLKCVRQFSYLVINYKNSICNVYCPTLIIWGNDDDIVPITGINYAYDNIKTKNIELFIINGVNHNIFRNERYIDIKNIIIKFLIEDKSNKKERYTI